MDFYGPPLPPGYKKDESDDEEANSPKHSCDSPKTEKLSKQKVIGPQCPDFIIRKRHLDSDDEDSSKIMKSESHHPIGPEIPPELQKSFTQDDDSDTDIPFGPVPINYDQSEPVNDIIATIEKRAIDMRNKLDQSDTPIDESMQREEWMIVPDTSRKNQLGAISRCLAPGSQKSESKHKKHHHGHSEKDRRTDEELKKYNKSKRSESLLEMHKKDKKKKDKKSSGPVERKAFDRDEIAVRQFNKDQVNSVIDKAQFLNSRFKAGASHYL